jgi:hypothetical protein
MRNWYRRACGCSQGRSQMDIKSIDTIIKTLKRKAHVLIYDGKRMGFPHGTQQGEEMFALLEMLERAVKRQNDG